MSLDGQGAAPALRVRPPHYTQPYPMLLVESTPVWPGQWLSARLSAGDLVGDTYWLGVGEHHAEAHALYPGARMLMVEHSGRWSDPDGTGIRDQVDALAVEFAAIAEQGGPTPVLVLDGVTETWEACKRWAEWRAGQSAESLRLLRGVPKPGSRRTREPVYEVPPDPHAAIRVPDNLWNEAHQRHRDLIARLRRLPAIVVLHAQTRVTADGGLEADTHRDVARAVSAWVRVPEDGRAVLVAARSHRHYLAARLAGREPAPQGLEPREEELTLESVVTEVLGWSPPQAGAGTDVA